MGLLEMTFVGYLVVLLGIGGYFFWTREHRDLLDYMLADRDIEFVPMALSEGASVASGWTFFAWVAFGFETGLNGLLFSFFFLVMVVILYLVVGGPFRRQSEAHQSLTITDHLASFFSGYTGILIRWVGTLAIIVFFGAYVGSQLQSVGEAIDVIFGSEPVDSGGVLAFLRAGDRSASYAVGAVGGGFIVIIYTFLGGFRASVWTDFIQAILVVGTAIALPVVAIQEMGGITAFLEQARAVDPSLLTLRGGHNGWDFVINILYWFTFALAVLGQPHSLMRFQSIANEEDLGKALGVAGGFQAIRMTLPLIIGIAGRVLYEGAAVEGTEQVGMMMIMDLFPALLAGLLLAGLISAIISTSDSMILVSATDVTRMVQEVFPDRTISKGTLVTVGRAFIILFSGLGILLALWEPGTIFDIILFAFAGLGATFGLPLLFVLFWDGTTGPGVFAGMIAGLVFSFLHQFHLYPDLFPIFLWPVTGVILIVVSLLTPDRAGEA